MAVSKRALAFAAVAVFIVGLASWAVVRFTAPPSSAKPAGATPGTPSAARRITATLFYIAADGLRLVATKREVSFGSTVEEQARYLIDAQLGPAPEGLTSAIPLKVTLRNVFVTENGDAYVDFSADLRLQHPGGSLNEIFTVYTVVHALTANLPAIHAVQILIDGHEADTLAGHVDLRRPLPAANQWLELPKSPSPPLPAVTPER
jgi:spore germination protein GerM